MFAGILLFRHLWLMFWKKLILINLGEQNLTFLSWYQVNLYFKPYYCVFEDGWLLSVLYTNHSILWSCPKNIIIQKVWSRMKQRERETQLPHNNILARWNDRHVQSFLRRHVRGMHLSLSNLYNENFHEKPNWRKSLPRNICNEWCILIYSSF